MQKAQPTENGIRAEAGVLILEPDDELRKVLGCHLGRQRWRVLESRTEQEALRLLELENPLVLIVEVEPPGNATEKLLQLFRENEVDQKLLIFTTLGRITRELHEKYRPEFVAYKPFDVRWISDRLDSFFGLNAVEIN
jgi:DNA-binding response OmpR family regulator